ncbi:MAG: hypothetical protein K9M51_02495 [Candidatus Gracilibacteria bacterium]|nr:hypothetical protein [Candidatus Gracilibacteria bacterium]
MSDDQISKRPHRHPRNFGKNVRERVCTGGSCKEKPSRHPHTTQKHTDWTEEDQTLFEVRIQDPKFREMVQFYEDLKEMFKREGEIELRKTLQKIHRERTHPSFWKHPLRWLRIHLDVRDKVQRTQGDEKIIQENREAAENLGKLGRKFFPFPAEKK